MCSPDGAGEFADSVSRISLTLHPGYIVAVVMRSEPMILRSSPTSPFGRKVKLVAHAVGLMDRIEIVRAFPADPDDSLRKENPLGKMPALILDDGTTLFDSRVIAEYLADLADDDRVFPEPPERWSALRLQALADGICDAGVLEVLEERLRPEDRRSPDWIAHQRGKIERGLNELEAAAPHLGEAVHIGHMALAAALGWLDFRFGGRWRDGRPQLVSWFEAAGAALPGFAETVPVE